MCSERSHDQPPRRRAAAVGLGLAASACGPELQDEKVQLPTSDKNELVCCTDAGTGPNESEFFGGGAPFEYLPDGGVP